MLTHHAAHGGYAENIQLLLERGANVNALDHKIDTPLHEAVRGNHTEVVKRLMESNACLYLTNKDEQTPLQLALKLIAPATK